MHAFEGFGFIEIGNFNDFIVLRAIELSLERTNTVTQRLPP